MKLSCSTRGNHALTRTDVAVIILVMIVLIVWLLPSLSLLHDGRMRVSCPSNLQQVNLACLLWAGDNNNKYPMEISVTNGGAKEFMDGVNAWKAFQILSNELATSKILICPQDVERKFAATNFADDLKNKISYFIAVDANAGNSKVLLTGDDNFLIGGTPVKSGLINLISNMPTEWNSTRHPAGKTHFWTPRRNRNAGNIGLGDGMVRQWNSDELHQAIRQTGLATNRLAIP